MTNTTTALRSRPINGVLLLDKPTGITSQAAVSRVKHLYAAAKAGHTGTLDPMASGLLPVCFGEATKFSHLLLDADKRYAATILLGITTTTGDMEGEVTRTDTVRIDRPAAEAVLRRFAGEIQQTPPMHSAIKHAGKALYRYARAGVTVDRAPRRVRIHRIELERFNGRELHVALACSKGTYVRVLAEDIGHALGCGACLSALRRTDIGAFSIDGAITLERLHDLAPEDRDAHLEPVDALVATLPRIDLDASQASRIRSGVKVGSTTPVPPGLVRIYGPGHDYLGIALAEPHGTLVPRRLMASHRVTARARQA